MPDPTPDLSWDHPASWSITTEHGEVVATWEPDSPDGHCWLSFRGAGLDGTGDACEAINPDSHRRLRTLRQCAEIYLQRALSVVRACPDPLPPDVIQEGLRLAGAMPPGPYSVQACSPGAESHHSDIVLAAERPIAYVYGWEAAGLSRGAISRCLTHAANHYAAALREVVRLRGGLAVEKERAEGWSKYADSLRCNRCTHPRGPIAGPGGLAEDGYALAWVCPCDCHADVAALREELARARADEREACALELDGWVGQCRENDWQDVDVVVLVRIAAAIRGRGN